MNKKAKNKSVPCFDMQFITSSISTTLVLLLLGLVVFFVLGAHNLSVYVKENINFSILISDDMKERDILRLQKSLNGEPFVKSTEYISKKQALEEQTEAMGTDPQEFLGYNPFSASIEVKLKSDYANADSIAKIEKQIRKNTDIQDVLYQKELVDEFEQFTDLVNAANAIVDDTDARYEAFAKAEAYMINNSLAVPCYYDCLLYTSPSPRD